MALVYPKQTDEYDVDVFNNNFKELKANIDTNNTNTANNLALKASIAYVDEAIGDMQVDVDDLRDTVAGETDSLSERITAETAARVNADNTINGILENKADSVHTHSADDIDTGILSVARGGTGNTSVDTAPTSGSTKMVTSGGVYTAIANRLPSLYTATFSVTWSTTNVSDTIGTINIECNTNWEDIPNGSFIFVGRSSSQGWYSNNNPLIFTFNDVFTFDNNRIRYPYITVVNDVFVRRDMYPLTGSNFGGTTLGFKMCKLNDTYCDITY